MTTAGTADLPAAPTAAAVAGPARSRQGHTLTGTWALVRLILRRDRVRLPVWIVGIVVLVLSSAALFMNARRWAAGTS